MENQKEICKHMAILGKVDGTYECGQCHAPLTRTDRPCPGCSGDRGVDIGNEERSSLVKCPDCGGLGVVDEFSPTNNN